MSDLLSQLEAVPADEWFDYDSRPIVEALETNGAGLDAVEIILTFMETHPEVDFGSPGGLVHFVERFFGKGYEALLLGSIERCPTPHTRWMLQRLINGTGVEPERDRLVAILEAAHG